MKTILLLPFLLYASALIASPFQIQKIESLDRSVSLDTGQNHTWWVTNREIDPQTHVMPVGKTTAEDRAGPGWKPVSVPGYLNPEHHPRGARRVWYRKTFLAPAAGAEGLTLRLGAISCEDRTYLNGRLIGATGKGKGRLAPYGKIRIYRIGDRLVRPGARNTLLVRVDACFEDSLGINRDRTEVGPALPMLEDFHWQTLKRLLFLASYFTAGTFFLLLFLRRRRDYEYLSFGVFSYLMVAYLFLRSQAVFTLGLDYYWSKKIEYLLIVFAVPIFYVFIRLLFRLPATRPRLWLDRGSFFFMAVSGACFLAILFTDSTDTWYKINTGINQLTWIFFLFLGPVGILAYRLSRKDREAMALSLPLLVVMIAIFIDILTARGLLNLPILTNNAGIIFFAAMALVLANRFVRASNQAEHLLARSTRLNLQLLNKNIQPHFLMNSLNAAIQYAYEDPETSVRLLQGLADSLRSQVRSVEQSFVPLWEEVQLCRKYLDIMNLRKGGSFALYTHADYSEVQVPPLILLTLVENGLTHGFHGRSGGHFTLKIRRRRDMLELVFFNNGASAGGTTCYSPVRGTATPPAEEEEEGSAPAAEKNDGMGLRYVAVRLEELFPDRWWLKAGPVKDGFQVRVRFPEG